MFVNANSMSETVERHAGSGLESIVTAIVVAAKPVAMPSSY